MNRLVVIIILLGLLFSSCSNAPYSPADDTTVNHVVLLWLKDPGNVQQQQQIIEATRSLEEIPGVIKIRVGKKITSPRPIVDDSFSVGIHMLFADRIAMENYLKHPEHTRTVTQSIMPFVDKIVIYDFEG